MIPVAEEVKSTAEFRQETKRGDGMRMEERAEAA